MPFLLQAVIDSNGSHTRYDHLSTVLGKILDERPRNGLGVFQNISEDLQRSKFDSEVDTVQDKDEQTAEELLAQTQRKLFARGDGDEQEVEPEEDADTPLPNLLELAFYFEQVSVGINREEVVRIWMSLKDLIEAYSMQTVRFWGKVIGTESNYYVAEVEFREGDEEQEEEEEVMEEHQEEDTQTEKDENEEGEEDEDEEDHIPKVPKPEYKPPPTVPREDHRTGANKKTYFVCTEPGKVWTRLPTVTPAQIQAARNIKKFFTGTLDASITSYPPFPGSELNYLRAQIARISAGTHISPLGFYQFDEEEEEEEEGPGRDNFVENVDFEGIPARELADPAVTNWVHHVQHILPQGRCTWWNPIQKGEDEFEDEEEEEDRDEPDDIEPEVGPPLLTPVSEDLEIANTPAWTAKISTHLLPQFAVAGMASNLWPGAHAFAIGKKFENVYIGYGHKYLPENYNPPETAPIQEEYVSSVETTEADDPTPEEEAALRAAAQEAAEAAEDEEVDEEASDED